MNTLKTYLLLLSAIPLLTGFSWGFGSDPCKNALEVAGKLDTVRNEAQKHRAEANIIAQCPDGAAAHYINALQLESAGNFDGAIEEYRRTLQQAPSCARVSSTDASSFIPFRA